MLALVGARRGQVIGEWSSSSQGCWDSDLQGRPRPRRLGGWWLFTCFLDSEWERDVSSAQSVSREGNQPTPLITPLGQSASIKQQLDVILTLGSLMLEAPWGTGHLLCFRPVCSSCCGLPGPWMGKSQWSHDVNVCLGQGA